MSLNIQINTIITSILFGIFLYFMLLLNKKILYHKKKLIKIIGTFIIIFVITILYFILMQIVNNGIFHIYEMICIILGYSLIALKHKK